MFQQAQIIVKVKEPQPAEWTRLASDQFLFAYLNQAAGLIESTCSAIAYETIPDDRNGLPLLAPMSKVAGRLSVIEGASCLKAHERGCGSNSRRICTAACFSGAAEANKARGSSS